MDTLSLHTALARSYLMYFLWSSIGLFVDSLVGVSVSIPFAHAIGFYCFVVGSFLIVWAQYTSRHHGTPRGEKYPPYFSRGPYRFIRNPTQCGILLVVLGYTALSGSIIFFAITLVGYILSNIFFRRYERVLGATYKDVYTHYQKDVPKIF
ncbi:MAG TPA: methyltransferase [Candidatus Paceibacterota bacterium]|nr:methyltransferase [Candidatus Paceibacterota bacterium]